MATNKQCVVIRKGSNEDAAICFEGTKPFLGTAAKAQDLADFLKSVNPECEYVVCAITELKAQGKVTARYANQAAGNPTKGRRRVNK
jgi:hypothetical protein